MKYKAGDFVLMRPGLVSDEKYGGVRFDESMKQFEGVTMTVDRVWDGSYRLTNSDYGAFLEYYTWTDEMLAPADGCVCESLL